MINAEDDLSSKIYEKIEKFKDSFFVIALNPPTSALSPLPGTFDPDDHISCELMDNRDTLLDKAREEHWEFSSLRRAKYSTMAMLLEVHSQIGDKLVYNCNNCQMVVDTRYQCEDCDVSDLIF